MEIPSNIHTACGHAPMSIFLAQIENSFAKEIPQAFPPPIWRSTSRSMTIVATKLQESAREFRHRNRDSFVGHEFRVRYYCLLMVYVKSNKEGCLWKLTPLNKGCKTSGLRKYTFTLCI